MLMKNTLPLKIYPVGSKSYSINIEVKKLGCSRHAARDIDSTNQLLEEIRGKGYQIHPAAGICLKSRYLLTGEDEIEVQGSQTSGEVEFVVISNKGQIYISVGSDHNDRTLEELWTSMLGKVFDTAKSKQMVPTIVASEGWLYDDVKGHWNALVLKSFITESGREIAYQEFRLEELLDPDYYLDQYSWLKEDGSILLSGSGDVLPSVPPHIYQGQSTLSEVTFPSDFHFEIYDPVLERSISHTYTVSSLEKEGSLSL